MSEAIAKEHRTASRVTSILEAVAASAVPVGLAALCAMLEAPKSSVHGLVKGLVATGYLEESAAGYTIGPAVSLLSSAAQPPILASARRALAAIRTACNESANLCKLVGESVVYVDQVESTQPIRYVAPLNVRRPLYPTSAGKCFLAYMSQAHRTKYLRSHLPDETAIARALRELEEVERNGYSTNRGETVADVYAVASPILIHGRIYACLQVAGPGSRLQAQLDTLAKLVKTEAQRLSLGNATSSRRDAV
jgi:DNA-binding IclR family transcriptional regulator